MAQEKKGNKKAQKKSDEAEETKSSAAEEHGEEHASAKEAHPDDAHDHGAAKAAAHGDGHGHGDHEHKPNRKEYWVIFAFLLILTVLEVGIAQVPGISKTLMRLGLVAMALAKAALVALFYMHLKHETRVLRLTVFIPLSTPALYAVVLISEAAWRLIR